MKERKLMVKKKSIAEGILDKSKVYIAIDTETGGLNPQYFGLIEVAIAIIINNRVIKRKNYFMFSPDKEYTEEALKLNGYSLEEVRKFPPSSKIVQEIKEDILFRYAETYEPTAMVPIGHNVSFDLGFMKQLFKDHNDSEFWDFNIDEENAIDTLALAKELGKKGVISPENNKLTTLIEYFNIKTSKLHKAKNDVDATIELLERLGKINNEGDVE